MSTASPTAPATAAPSATAPAAAPAAATASPSNGMDRAAFLTMITNTAKVLPDAELANPELKVYPFHDVATKRSCLAAAMSIDCRSKSNPDDVHTVILARRVQPGSPPAYFSWCGDQFLEGRTTAASRSARVNGAVRDLPLSKSADLRRDLDARFGTRPQNAACGFWREHARNPAGGGCEHTRAVFAEICTEGAESVLASIDALHDELANNLASRDGVRSSPFVTGQAAAAMPTMAGADAARAVAVAAIEAELRKDKIIDEILDHTGPGVIGKMPLILIGDTGWGKTENFRIIKRAGLYDEVHEMPISPGMDALDLVGMAQKVTRRREDGSNESLVFHVDSPFVQAARAAATGKQVAILFDELPRASRTFLSAIPAIINPDGDSITITTGRAVHSTSDGVASIERVTFKRANLAIWATGNPGGNYDCNGFTDGGDLATINRFHRVYVRPDPEKAKRIIGELASAHSWPMPAAMAMTKWYVNMEKLAGSKDTGINRRVTLRDIGWSFDMVRGNHQAMGKTLHQWANRWVGFDLEGFPNQDQMKAVHDAIDNAFGVAKAK